jgi:DNA-binding NarL/FixJ family response regulator
MTQSIRVLVAEDEALVAEMIEGLLSEIGCSVAGRASDGREAVARTRELLPDVVLMDLEMPGGDGVEATRQIHAAGLAPVVVLTAHVTRDWHDRAVRAGAGGYLGKPVTARALEHTIRVARARFRERVELEARIATLAGALERALSRGMLPVCAECRRVRDDDRYWQEVESYISGRTEDDFVHGLCPDCVAVIVRKRGGRG